MRVVLATNQFPKFSETFIVRQLLGLLELGWDMHVVCPSSDPAQWDFYPELRDDDELRARVHPTRDFETTVAGLRADLVHFEFGAVAVGRTDAVARTGARQLVTFRGYDLNYFRAENPHCYDEVWEHADAVHVVSTDLWQRARRRGCPADKRHEIIHDAVDLDAFTPEGREYAPVVGTPERPLRVLSVGRLHWKKGYEFGLEAVRLLVDAGVRCEYRVVGDGEHREAVVYTIDDLGLGDVVRLEGARRGDEVNEALLWADVLLHNAVSEGFCVAALEAQATGLPVVCTDADGLRENVAHGETGIVVRRRDPAAATQALRELAGSPTLRRLMGANGRRRAAMFSFEEQHRRFDRLYRSILAPGASDVAPAADSFGENGAARPDGDADRVLEALTTQVPAEATVLVVSRGDDGLVAFERWRASHFPQDEEGGYAGFYPADSGEAISHLEDLRAGGAEYLVFPPTARWWLEHYRGLRMHLESTYRVDPSPAGGCVVVSLTGGR
ncbi:MAG TPA: glycosyltransferase family 4 protein [Acidimicrobiales bacterium]|nr:glycosyltransferase family 4 protein [Acidimicrobiales bacterium]